MPAAPTTRALPHPSRRWAASGARPTIHRSVTALSEIPLFTGFSKRHLRRLAEQAEVVRYSPGRPIVDEGQAGEAMFVVLSGSAKVVRGRRTVARMIPGDFFGELSTLDGGPRSASIVAETHVEVLRLFRHTLLEMLRSEPSLVLRMLEGLARRMRHLQPGATKP